MSVHNVNIGQLENNIIEKGGGWEVALKKCDGGCRWRGCIEKVSKWLLIDYQILPAKYLLFWCETQWEEDIASKVICVLSHALSLIISVAMIRRKMLVKKDVFHLITSVGQRKYSLRNWSQSPHEESNLRPSDSELWCSTTEPQRLHGEWGLLQSSYDMCPAYC